MPSRLVERMHRACRSPTLPATQPPSVSSPLRFGLPATINASTGRDSLSVFRCVPTPEGFAGQIFDLPAQAGYAGSACFVHCRG